MCGKRRQKRKFRCEVCEVSVNSSHQLQAHMTGDFPAIHIFPTPYFLLQVTSTK